MLLTALRRKPVLFAATFAAAKGFSADLAIQTVVEKKKFSEVDKQRLGFFTAFGFR